MTASREHLLDELRPMAFGIAYRMLGTVSEAEDIVQEALLRLHRVLEAGEGVESPRAYIATITTRLAIDHLRSARVRREQYVGEWIPEPILEETAEDPAHRAELAESVSLAFLSVLERLTPEQRAAFLLRDVFAYDYAEIARIIGKREANARQLVVRARRHVAEHRPRFEVADARRERLAKAFFAALREGDLAALESRLAEDVVLHGDGGGKVPALGAAISGRDHVARTLAAWARMGERVGGTLRRTTVNGVPGAVIGDGSGSVWSVMALEFDGDHVVAIRSIVNPDKLRHVGPVGDMEAALRAARS